MIVLNNHYSKVKKILILSFIFFVFIPTLALGFITFFYASNIIETNTIKYTCYTLEQLSYNIEKDANRIADYLYVVSMSNNVQDFIKATKFNIKESTLNMHFDDLDKYFNSYISIIPPEMINTILIATANNKLYHFKEKIYLDQYDFKQISWYKDTVELGGKINWIGIQQNKSYIHNDSETFIVCKSILDQKKLELIGVIFLSLKPSFFFPDYINENSQEPTYIINSEGQVLIHSGNENESNSYLKGFINNILKTKTTGHTMLSKNGEKHILVYSSPNVFGWRVLKTIPYKTLTSEILKVRNFTIFIILGCMIFFAIFMIVTYRDITLPLQYMVNLLNEIENSYTEIDFSKFPCYELIKISSSIISLVEKNKVTSHELSISKKQEKKMELSKLQAQINPHFLYNTLNSIKYIALSKQQKEISQLITSLVKLLKNSVNKEGNFITVKQEIENLKHYIYIESVIHKDKITFIYDFDPNLNGFLIPNFILQPLVENSIFHGIDPNSGNGKITIRNFADNNVLVFQVEDNGVGMNDEQINQLLYSHNDKSNLTKLGIYAIHQKIQLLYGNKYGLNINSKLGLGTKITIRIPIQQYYIKEE